MDISETLAPDSDQLDAIDLLGGPRVFTITKVSKGNAEQPVNIHLAEFPRVWRPGKSMRRVLAACWGTDASAWVGRRVKLYCDERVRFGNDVVGGTRIAALSHIDKTRSVPLLVSRGRSATFKVEPLGDEAPVTSPEPQIPTVIDTILHGFADLGVTQAQLEAHLALPVDEWSGSNLDALRALGGEISRGEKNAADVFGSGEN